MIRHCFLLLISIILLSTDLYSQVQTGRYELKTRWNHREFMVFEADSSGVLLMHEQKPDGSSQDSRVKLVMLDENLVQTGTDEILIPEGYHLRNQASSGSLIFLVFTREVFLPNDQYIIVEVDIINPSVRMKHVSSDLPFDLHQVAVVNGSLLLAGQTNGIPLLLRYVPESIRFQGIEINKNKGNVVSLRPNDDGKSFNLITTEFRDGKHLMNFRTYYEAEVIFDKVINLKEDVLEARSVGFVDGNIVVAGTYGSRKNQYITGIFHMLLTPGEEPDEVTYHDFSAFKNFFAFELADRADKLNEKARERAESGKELKLDKLLFIRQLENIDGRIVLRVDVHRKFPFHAVHQDRNHYELMHRKESQNLDSYLLQHAHNPRVFEYYRGQNQPNDDNTLFRNNDSALQLLQQWVIGFDEKGNITWDNSMPVLYDDRMTGRRIIGSSISSSNVHFLYFHDDHLIFSTIPNTSERAPEYMVPIALRNDQEKLLECKGYITEGPGPAMYVWGFQRIKGENGKRNVLYINKVEFVHSPPYSAN